MTNAIYWLSFVANGDDPEQGRLYVGLPARNDADAWRAGLVQAALIAAGHECTAEYEVRSQIGPEEEDGMTVTRVVTTRASVKLPEPPPLRFAIPEPPEAPAMYLGDSCNEAYESGWADGWRAGAEHMAVNITNHLNPPAPPAANEGEQPHG